MMFLMTSIYRRTVRRSIYERNTLDVVPFRHSARRQRQLHVRGQRSAQRSARCCHALHLRPRCTHTHTHSLSLSLSLSLSPVYVGTALSHTSSFKCYLCVLGRRDQRRTLYLGATLPESRYCNKSMMMMMMTTRWQRPRQQP